MAEVRMPKMGDGMEEGTILRWMKQEGDSVKADEPIAEIETDKANVEMPAEESGTLTKIMVKEGETVPVGAVIAIIGDGSAKGSSGNGAHADTTDTSVVSGTPPEVGEEGSTPISNREPAPPPPVSEGASSSAGPESERVKASPLARRMAQEQGIDLAHIKGTGPGGRIVEKDITAFTKGRGAGKATPTMPSAPSEAPARPLATTAAPSLTGEDVEITKMRKAIARRTVQSKQTIPHFYLVMPVEMDSAMRLLNDINEGATPETKITVNDLIVKACAVALSKFPDVNVSFTPDEKIRRYPTINIGVAVGTDQGLTIPVIPDCGNKTLRQISADAKALINKARNNQLTPQEMSSGTFSVSNLGMFGVEEFMAIINPPESGILAVGAVAKEVAVAEDGSFEVRQRMRATLSCDHRTVDGVLGAKFLQEVKRLLETPFNLLA
jgi:pyruvate dehydrogenase E2 component (dihydrolipoamide acetyltransferase)